MGAAPDPAPAADSSPPAEAFRDGPCGHLTTDARGVVTAANAALLSWVDRPAGDVIGTGLGQLLTAGGRIYLETHCRPLLAMQGEIREIALDMLDAGGAAVPVLLNADLDEDADGEPAAVRYAIFRATARRSYERELLDSRRRAQASEARARELAETLQSTFIPPALPDLPAVDLAAAYRPAGDGGEVGGDFYDVFTTSPGEWMVVVGDVAGKGAAAAVVTALARFTLRAAAMHARSPGAVLAELNAALLREDRGQYCTVVLVRLRLRPEGGMAVTLASGGHPPALHLTPGGVVPVEATGTMLGVTDSPSLPDHDLELAPGDGLFLHTDGFTEGRRGDAFFGDERLRDHLADLEGLSAATAVISVVDELVRFQHGHTRDDMAAVLLRADRRQTPRESSPEDGEAGTAPLG